MKYHDAFLAARSACKVLGRRIYLLHDPAGCDGPPSEAYEYGDSVARTFLYTHATVIATLVPLPNGVEINPVARPTT